MSEIVIEIASQRKQEQSNMPKSSPFRPKAQPSVNGSALFQPLGEKLRGRWATHEMHGISMHPALQSMPSPIPGERLGVDVATRHVRRFDPLALPGNKELWDSLRRHFDINQNYFGKMDALKEDYVLENANQTTIKTWLYWMRRLIDADLAKTVPGSSPMPALDLIASLPGLTQIGQFNEMANVPMYRELFDDYFTLRPDWQKRKDEALAETAAGNQAMAAILGGGSGN